MPPVRFALSASAVAPNTDCDKERSWPHVGLRPSVREPSKRGATRRFTNARNCNGLGAVHETTGAPCSKWLTAGGRGVRGSSEKRRRRLPCSCLQDRTFTCADRSGFGQAPRALRPLPAVDPESSASGAFSPAQNYRSDAGRCSRKSQEGTPAAQFLSRQTLLPSE